MKKIALLALFFAIFCTAKISFADDSDKTPDGQVAQRVALSYAGWAVVKKHKLDPNADQKEWVSMRDIEITDDGKKVRIMDGENPTPYSLELIVITYESSNTTVLKLALYEDGNEKSITYIWGEPEAHRLGMNLRWMQAGFTKVSNGG